jgi:hypothetical protein
VDVTGTVYAALVSRKEVRLWSSTDKGARWERRETSPALPAPGPESLALETDSLHPGMVYLAGGRKLFLVGPEGCREICADLPPVRRLLVL